jgi:hypothetical protein
VAYENNWPRQHARRATGGIDAISPVAWRRTAGSQERGNNRVTPPPLELAGSRPPGARPDEWAMDENEDRRASRTHTRE